jgi:PAS domain S-box-containing protein
MSRAGITNKLLANIFLEQMPFSIYWKDTQGRYLGGNNLFLKLHDKHDISQVINKTASDLYSTEVAQKITCHEAQVLSSAKCLVFEEDINSNSQKIINLLSYKAPIIDEEAVTGILCVSIDITDIKKQKSEVENILQNVLSALPEHIYWKDINGVIIGCNDQQAISVGFTSYKEMIGKTPYDTLPKEQADIIHAIDMEIISSGVPKTLTEKSSRKDGTIATYESKKVPLFDKETNQVVGLVGVSFDITDRLNREEREKQAVARAAEERVIAEAEAELRRAVTVFAGSIAHDLRVPLASMSIMIDLFTRYWLDFINEHEQFIVPQNSGMMRMHLEKIDSFPNKMKKLISDMNNFINGTLNSMQHLVSGTLSYEDFVVCHIEPCVRDAISIYPFKTEETTLVHIDINNNFSFFGYPILFCRVISNLIKNSLEQIEKNNKGEIFITTSEADNFNLLHFKDTAGGTSSAIIEHMFDGYKTTKTTGTGVGLPFCKLTMQSFDGDITCNSTEGDYIEFILSFPKLES